jgi:hypothetical protein
MRVFVFKTVNHYVHSGMIGQDINLTLKDRIKLLFCKKIAVCLFGNEFIDRIDSNGEKYIK